MLAIVKSRSVITGREPAGKFTALMCRLSPMLSPSRAATRRSALKVVISGMDFRSFARNVAGAISRCKAYRAATNDSSAAGAAVFRSRLTFYSVEQAGDRTLLADPPDRLSH